MASIVAARNGVASIWSRETAPNAGLRVSQLRDNDTRITSSRQLRLLAARRSIYAARALFVCFYCCETIYRCRRVSSHVRCLRKNYYFYPPGRNSNRPVSFLIHRVSVSRERRAEWTRRGPVARRQSPGGCCCCLQLVMGGSSRVLVLQPISCCFLH